MRAGEVKRSLVGFLLSLAMALSIVFVIVGAQGTRADGPDPPIHIHLTWRQDDTAHTIVVTWKTLYENAGDNVLYDTQPRGGYPDNYDYSAVGSHHTYSGAGGYIHDVELTGLSPNTVYYFICGGENGGWSAERRFRTAPETSSSIRFVAGGDSRSGGDWPGPRDNISRTMARFNPSFVLFGGDLVNRGDNQWEWDNWFAAAQMYWVDNDNLTIPIIPSIGNHELSGDPNGVGYKGQFCLPENENWYSLDWGPDLHIIVLNSETSETGISGVQRDWLEQDLAAHENCMWKIALFHTPAYSSYRYSSWIRDYWVPLFDEYHVDLVVEGHDHYYERTYPIYENKVQPAPEDGTIYIVSGGWGAPLYTGTPKWFTAYGPDNRYHFVVIDILENGTLYLKAVDRNNSVFDTFTITKPRIKVSISPTYQAGLPGSTLNYAVTVTNTWTENDNYALTVIDNENWSPMLPENLLENVEPGENRTVTLSVTIPESAVGCTVDNITVIATSKENIMIKENDSCIAHAFPWEGTATFKLENMYKVSLEKDLKLYGGKKLVVKFYKYDNTTLQAESIVDNITPPENIKENENVPHPLGAPVPPSKYPGGTVQIARLVLTTDNTAEVISEIASFTVHQSDLKGRFFEILGAWFPHPELHDAFRAEVRDILGQWFAAPP